ncbi:MAG: TonB-dependent receptor, partial [Burkholderiales bacterium]|nr:TonB-dependent receptor [Burkholderiales bacterium]
RAEELKDVPVSESVVTGDELQKLDAYGIGDIVKRAGNVTWNYGNQRTSSLSIRGLGKVGQTEAQDPSVGVIVDGVPYSYNPLTSSYDFTDIDTIEVARGPQGTLLGKEASVGSIIINTKRPSFTPSAEYSLTFGQNNEFIGTLAGGGSVVDGLLAWRGSFSVDRGQGTLAESVNPDITFTNTDRVSGRLQFLLTPSENFSALIAISAQPRTGEATNGYSFNKPQPLTYSNGTAVNQALLTPVILGRSWFTQDSNYNVAADYYNGGPNGRTVYDNGQYPLVIGSRGDTATLNWSIGQYTLTSISSYKEYYFHAVNDEGSPFDILRNSGGFLNNYKQYGEELRLASPVGGFVDYQAGLFYQRTATDAVYQKSWGADAGAFYASAAQYKLLDSTAAGQLLMLNSLDNIAMAYNSPAGDQRIRNQDEAIFGQANWHFTDALTLTTGVRESHAHRQTTASSYVTDQGNAPELNPVLVNGVNEGGFLSSATGALLPGNTAAQLQLADTVASKYFGVAATGTPGAAYSSLTATQQQQVAYAKAIRQAQEGVLFKPTAAQPFSANLPAYTVSPSYKLNKDQTAYLSWQYGQKSGVSQLVNGVSSLVKAEKDNAVELGLKSNLLNHTLTVNADYYVARITNYQQAVRVLDLYTTQLQNNGQLYYTTATGNVPQVDAHGLEVDAAYNGIKNLTLRFSGAYNIARYEKFPN